MSTRTLVATISVILVISMLFIGALVLPLNSNPGNNNNNVDTRTELNEQTAAAIETAGHGNIAVGTTEPFDPDTSRRGSRDTFYPESETNNNFADADDITYEFEHTGDPPFTITGQLASKTDVDYFKIKLGAGEKSTDNLTITVTSLTSNYWNDVFYISVFGTFEEKLSKKTEYLHMKTVECMPRNWNGEEDCPPATIYTFAPGNYYIRTAIYNPYSWATTSADYNLKVAVESTSAPDSNQVIEFADELIKPTHKKNVSMDKDIFDWYYISAPDPQNYSTNLSISIEITSSTPMTTENINSQQIYFVPEVNVLIYHEVTKNNYESS